MNTNTKCISLRFRLVNDGTDNEILNNSTVVNRGEGTPRQFQKDCYKGCQPLVWGNYFIDFDSY